MNDILKGELVRLSAIDPEEMSGALARWRRDSEFNRLLNMGVIHLDSAKAIRQWIEKDMENEGSREYFFAMRSLADDQLIGGLGLDVVAWAFRDAFVAIFIGEREYWGKGYGTDAMNVLLEYAFLELNLRRVSLGVFEYNPRAIRSYEKVGFRNEGRQRSFLNREGRRWSMFLMGILRNEWMEQNHKPVKSQ